LAAVVRFFARVRAVELVRLTALARRGAVLRAAVLRAALRVLFRPVRLRPALLRAPFRPARLRAAPDRPRAPAVFRRVAAPERPEVLRPLVPAAFRLAITCSFRAVRARADRSNAALP
jgi:hypothetical protein